jgi:hypothetical protein
LIQGTEESAAKELLKNLGGVSTKIPRGKTWS